MPKNKDTIECVYCNEVLSEHEVETIKNYLLAKEACECEACWTQLEEIAEESNA